jgi:RNA recognition motif-containing protein
MEYKLFVGNIPFDCTKFQFKTIFKKYTGFKSADLVNENNKCFGFVIFDNINIIEDIIKTNNVFIKDRKLRLTRYNNKIKETTNYIRIKNIPNTVSIQDIRTEFQNYSEVGKCFIDMDRTTGKYKDTGIVEIIETDIFEQLLDLDVILINDHQILIEKYDININSNSNFNIITNHNKEKKYKL